MNQSTGRTLVVYRYAPDDLAPDFRPKPTTPPALARLLERAASCLAPCASVYAVPQQVFETRPAPHSEAARELGYCLCKFRGGLQVYVG